MGRLVYLDTETTGIGANTNTIVEVAIVDDSGSVLINSLINPLRPIPKDASAIHGITDRMVINAPTLTNLWPEIQKIVKGSHVVIYNAEFDRKFFPGQLSGADRISCAMLEFAKTHGERDPYGRGYKWKKLDFAASHVSYRWTGDAHRALADAMACRAVWHWLCRRS